jgi:hypothetical protein
VGYTREAKTVATTLAVLESAKNLAMDLAKASSCVPVGGGFVFIVNPIGIDFI